MTVEPEKEPVVAREKAHKGASVPASEVLSAQIETPVTIVRSDVDLLLRDILRDVLALEAELVASFNNETGLFGHLPELDSMAVATLFTEMEDRLDIIIEDDDVDGEMLETYGGLLIFAESKTVAGTIES